MCMRKIGTNTPSPFFHHLLNINDLIWQVDCASVNIHWHYPSKSGKFDLALIELVITNPNTFSNNACPLLSVKKITRRNSLEHF